MHDRKRKGKTCDVEQELETNDLSMKASISVLEHAQIMQCRASRSDSSNRCGSMSK